MEIWFLDDSRQRFPSRDQMGPLCAAGGIRVEESRLKQFEASLETLCQRFGFPATEEFKWSPGHGLWMQQNLVADERTRFFVAAAECARDNAVVGVLVCEDTNFQPLTTTGSHEVDVVRLLLERIHNHTAITEQSLVVADRPGGGNIRANDQFISGCLDTLRTGTNAVAQLDRISMVLTCSSHLTRCLQFADVFTSCLTGYVGGENRFSPPVATALRPLIRESLGRVGGVGIKIHPDYRYANLYHWLFGDGYLVKGNIGTPLPLGTRPYATDANAYYT